ncbi:MAG: tRNA1(Val) (adenine(37)-N6)-methyltransferase [Selenomonadaceae bacterium]|nr:tRNA1(Val) (adenine(37)-N6)-methyltransferase [Selenomonadaceae bacterium]
MNAADYLSPDERIDDLMRSGRTIIQREDEFCFSMDAVLIAHFPKFKSNARVLDLGTGTGVIPLLIADNVKEICAIELNHESADMARRSIEMNNLTNKISVVEGDYREHRKIFRAESFDLVIANPPYTPVPNGEANRIGGIARARHEFTATLEDVVTAARYVLKFHGVFCMIHSAMRLSEIIDALRRHQMEPKRLRMIHPKAGRDANLVMIEALVGGNIGNLKVMPPLIVHEDNGSYTEEIYKIYNE